MLTFFNTVTLRLYSSLYIFLIFLVLFGKYYHLEFAYFLFIKTVHLIFIDTDKNAIVKWNKIIMLVQIDLYRLWNFKSLNHELDHHWKPDRTGCSFYLSMGLQKCIFMTPHPGTEPRTTKRTDWVEKWSWIKIKTLSCENMN